MGKQSTNSIVIIGAGNVATYFATLLFGKGILISQVLSKHTENAKKLAKKVKATYSTDIKSITKDTSLILIAVPDDAIENVVKQIPQNIKSLVVHTSGSTGMGVFKEHNIKNAGVIYPLQSINKSAINAVACPVLIEATTTKSKVFLKKIAKNISTEVLEVNSQQRATIHLSAVFANNFTNYLYSIAWELLVKEKIDPTIILPLLQKQFSQLTFVTNPFLLQTGPAKRGDKKIMTKQQHLLKKMDTEKKIYKLISGAIQKHL